MVEYAKYIPLSQITYSQKNRVLNSWLMSIG